ncbi:MAG: DegV family protein [Ruminococcus sp.]|nr:DegV family protein [Ruminococcus sp.]
MQKILIMTDSACDLEPDVIKSLDIKVLPFNIAIDDLSFKEGVDKSKKEVYELMESSDSIPKTAQITSFEFEEAYKEAFEKGYTHIIYVSISASASATHSNAIMAINNFFEENPDAKNKLEIKVIDSKGYTGMYGYPLIEAAKKVAKGADAESVIAYIEEWCSCVTAYFVPMTLKYAKKSGRISAAAAFAGELLGLKPIIEMIDGASIIHEKIRGEKNIIPKLMAQIEKVMTPQTPYVMLTAKDDTLAKELEKEMIKKYGYKAEYYSHVGAAVAANAGPDLVGVAFRKNISN